VRSAAESVRELTFAEKGLRWALVVSAFGAALIAFLLPPATGGALHLGGWELPGLCIFRGLFGIDCPGCGLTRSWVALAHGDLGASLSYHLLGPALFAFVLLQAMRQLVTLVVPRSCAALAVPARWLDLSGVALAICLLPVWVLRLV
jgi:hypothetical protein